MVVCIISCMSVTNCMPACTLTLAPGSSSSHCGRLLVERSGLVKLRGSYHGSAVWRRGVSSVSYHTILSYHLIIAAALTQGPNILMDDTLSSEGVDKSLLNAVKDSIVQVCFLLAFMAGAVHLPAPSTLAASCQALPWQGGLTAS